MRDSCFFRRFGLFAAVLASATAAGASGVGTEVSPLEPATSGGLQALDRALVRLSNHHRLLVVAAHPDDEDTALLTWVARGLGGEAAYLSLSRGDGGQNLIGPELGVGLGLLRSRELLAARRIDGARQYFTRAFDFGYTRSLEETWARWPREVLLEDAVRVVRRFKPQVLVAVFPPTAAAGHGQHQASAVVAEEVFELAADAAAFPHLGPPWKIESFFRAAWWNPDAASLELPLGRLEPFSGRSILQLALASRSQHRCQDMGVLQPMGDADSRLIWVGGQHPDPEDVFAGIDTELTAIADLLPEDEGGLRLALRADLERVAALAAATRRQLDPADPATAAEPLLEIVRRLRDGVDRLPVTGSVLNVRDLLEEKLDIAQEAAANAAQVLVDVVTDRQTVVAGEQIELRSIFWNAGPLAVAAPGIEILSDDGWQLLSSEAAPPSRSRFATRVDDERVLTVEVPPGAPPTLPYFLSLPLVGDLYDWGGAAAEVLGEPFEPPPVSLRFRFDLAGVDIELTREVVQRVRDQAYGEVRRPLRVVPKLEVAVDKDLIVWPISSRDRHSLRVEIRSNAAHPVTARLEVEVPDGWPPVPSLPVEVPPRSGEVAGRRTVDVDLISPEPLPPGRYPVFLAAVDEADERFDRSIRLVDYEHIRPTPMPIPARVEIAADHIRLPASRRLGYVRGASDRMPELLREIGLPVELLSADELEVGELAVYEAIVIGPRAYETDPSLAAANQRLLDYVRGGGLLVVQYQQYQFAGGGYAPFPLDIARPHDRVTDETAAVRLLEPEHPVFQSPNRLELSDWDDWVQERGLYFAGTWDDAYQPLLAMADPGGEELRGSLLVASLGEGHYVYTGLAFFRQLPAGVTGAYRLFANLLALGEER